MRLASLLVAVALAGCFSPDTPNCSFRCDEQADNSAHCPDGYTCDHSGTVAVCRRNDYTGTCAITQDLAMSLPDMTVSAVDMRVADGGAADMSAVDQASPPDLVPLRDLTPASDLTMIDF
jgi:hypothetical protein